MLGFPAPFGKKGIDRCPGLASNQSPGQGLRLSDYFIDGSDADLATVELDHDIAPAFETDRFAKLRWNAEATGFGDAPSYGTHARLFDYAIVRIIWYHIYL
jgi:hypothetical protein